MHRIQRAVAGDPLELNRLLLDVYRPLHARVTKKLPSRLRATISPEDIIQEAFSQAFQSIGGFRPTGPDSFFKWVCTIADHRVVDAVRAHKSAKRGGGKPSGAPGARTASSVAALIDLVATNQQAPSHAARGQEAMAAVQVALAGLSPEYKRALQLRYLEGLSVSEVSARMGRTESAIHKLCSRALQDLRDAMGEASRYVSRA
jgi:RNA polymerase sigma-70 factor (ECF subfamily)